MMVTNPRPRKVRKWPYVHYPDKYMCITQDDAYFSHTENRMKLPFKFYGQRYISAATFYDAARGAGNGGGEPYDLDRGHPSGHFGISTFSSRRVRR